MLVEVTLHRAGNSPPLLLMDLLELPVRLAVKFISIRISLPAICSYFNKYIAQLLSMLHVIGLYMILTVLPVYITGCVRL